MQFSLYVLLFFFALNCSISAPGDAIHLLTSPTRLKHSDSIESVIVNTIDLAQKITLAMYCMTSQQIADALLRAIHRGVTITIITDYGNMASPYSTLLQIAAHTRFVTMFYQENKGTMHEKTLCAELAATRTHPEERYVTIIGSYNYTDAAKKHKENIVIEESKETYETTIQSLLEFQTKKCCPISPTSLGRRVAEKRRVLEAKKTIKKTSEPATSDVTVDDPHALTALFYSPTRPNIPESRRHHPSPAAATGACMVVLPRATPPKDAMLARKKLASAVAGEDIEASQEDPFYSLRTMSKKTIEYAHSLFDGFDTLEDGEEGDDAMLAIHLGPLEKILEHPFSRTEARTSHTKKIKAHSTLIDQKSFKETLIQTIRSSKEITIGCYSITDSDVAEALTEQQQKGSRVTLITDKTQSTGTASCVPMLIAAGVAVYIQNAEVMHLKTILFHLDNGTYKTFNGSSNISTRALCGLNQERTMLYSGKAAYEEFKGQLLKTLDEAELQTPHKAKTPRSSRKKRSAMAGAAHPKDEEDTPHRDKKIAISAVCTG